MEKLLIPSALFPVFRADQARKDGVAHRLLFLVHGGIGDQICAEPTLRYALDHFKNEEISLAAVTPELFSHLKFRKVFQVDKDFIDYSKYLVLPTLPPKEHLNHQFMTHFLMNSVDYHSIAALRMQLPIEYKTVRLDPQKPTDIRLLSVGEKPLEHVLIHAGNHWASRSYPKDWWDAVYDEVCNAGLTPVLIGKTMGSTQAGEVLPGYVPVKCDGRGIDFRDQCTLNDTIWLSKNSGLVLCSDSGPLHMAVTGSAHVAFLSTARHPDLVNHWRSGGWGWRMKSFEKGGVWSTANVCPNAGKDVEGDQASPEQVRSWLPEPKTMVDWLVKQRNQ